MASTPDIDPELADRALGAFLGLAIGDALGTALEFKPPGTFAPIQDLVGGGPFALKPGQGTDDTSMALCLAASFIAKGGCDPIDQLERYQRWRDRGYMSSTGECFDIGNTVNDAISRFVQTEEAECGSQEEEASGNGALMRLAPAVIFNFIDLEQARRDAHVSTITTHGSELCTQCSDLFAQLLWHAINGGTKEELCNPELISGTNDIVPLRPEVQKIVDGSYKGRSPPEIRGTGYVVASLEAALWAFYTSNDFKSGALNAANLGDDADTTAAIYGQIAGAYYGASGIPSHWQTILQERDRITAFAPALLRIQRRTDK